MDECRPSVCGDSVQPHIFDEPDLTYHDLDLLPTPVEDSKGDEGLKDGSQPVPNEEPASVASIEFPSETDEPTAPFMIMTLGGCFHRSDKSRPPYFSVKLPDDGPEATYYLLNEHVKDENGKKFSCQTFLRGDLRKE